MKFKRLCATTLLSVIAVGATAPVLASAATQTHSAISEGRVTVEAGDLDPTDPIVDPEDPGKDIDPDNPEITPGTDPGTLGITNVSKLNFGTIKTASKAVTANAAALVTKTDDTGATTETRGALVQFGDTRGTNAGYTVTAQITRPFELKTDTTKKLDGATIKYNYGIMETRADNMATPGTMSTSLDALGYDSTASAGNSITVVSAAQGSGAGVYVLEFGQSKDYTGANTVLGMTGTKETDDKAVTLTVPAATASSMVLGDYTADITWTIGALA
ncbi:WxL domain-containing protein [Enterococcus sp. LJL90]